jgi:hypothetical protein
MDTLAAAVRTYRHRQVRLTHPDGRTDRGGRWYPSDEERQACCTVRSPSRKWPWSLMLHCRTLRHIARLYGVNESELRGEVKQNENN